MAATGHSRAIPPLVSGGIMLSYRCTNACRHCLYRCSPRRPDDWLTLETAGRVFDALARERDLHSVHLAGGEATLRFDLLVDVVRMADRAGIPLAYLETNAHWCGDREETRWRLEALSEAGLPAILVSASMFHNEFVPFNRTRNCVEVGREVFGHGNVIVWLPHLYSALERLPDEVETRSLAAFCDLVGIPRWSPEIPALYQVVPGGRAPEALRRCYRPRPAESYRAERCGADLFSTTHFHIDHHGNLFTGLCAGIVAGDLEDLHPTITEEEFPVFATLAAKGPWGLSETASREYGFSPDEEGYASKCDLCYRARRHLFEHGDFEELKPADYYECA